MKKIFLVIILFLVIVVVQVFSGNIITKSGQLNISDDFIVADDALFVNSTSKRVGINTTDPQAELHVDGGVRIEDFPSCTAIETDVDGDIVCGVDDIADADADATNEIQDIIVGEGLTRDVSNNFGIQDCAANEIMKRDSVDSSWVCTLDDPGVAVEVDPIYSGDPAAGIEDVNISNWNIIDWIEIINRPLGLDDGDDDCSVDGSCVLITYDSETATWDKDDSDDITTANIGSQNVDQVDGFDLDQDVKTTATPGFDGINIGGGYGMDGLTIDTNGNLQLDGNIIQASGKNYTSDSIRFTGDYSIALTTKIGVGVAGADTDYLLIDTDGHISDNDDPVTVADDLAVTGAASVTGALSAASFSGDGSLLTGTAAGLTVGTANDLSCADCIGVTEIGDGLGVSEIDETVIQQRVSSFCAAGESIRIINQDGTVTCETDDDSGGDITGVTAGIGLSGGGLSGDVTLDVVEGNGIDIIADAVAVNETELTCTSIPGLSADLCDDGDAVDDSVETGELESLCATDDRVLKRTLGTWGCAVDIDTNADTICADGQFLNGDGTCDTGDSTDICDAGNVCMGGHLHGLSVTVRSNSNTTNTVTVDCLADEVRVSCSGYISGGIIGSSLYAGSYPDGANPLRCIAGKAGIGTLFVDAFCAKVDNTLP